MKCAAAALVAAVAGAVLAGPSDHAAPGKRRWFGLSGGDFSRVDAFFGAPLKVKARFVGLMEPGAGGPQARPVKFVVEAAAGEIVCTMMPRAPGAELLSSMKRATPLILCGEIDPRTYELIVEKLLQGWHRELLEDGACK